MLKQHPVIGECGLLSKTKTYVKGFVIVSLLFEWDTELSHYIAAFYELVSLVYKLLVVEKNILDDDTECYIN